MDVREDIQAASTKGGCDKSQALLHSSCTLLLQKEGGQRQRREGHSSLWHEEERTRGGALAKSARRRRSWKSDAAGQSVRKVVTALLQTDPLGCWIKDGVQQNATQNTVSCREAACTVILRIQEYGMLIIKRMFSHTHAPAHTQPATATDTWKRREWWNKDEMWREAWSRTGCTVF